ncbi:MAG: imidazole glycerol phosphate synthase subunit HisH [Bacteroidales bacterium]|nr:imidazole glycerol phosphate synthase subunit HisH [Bacteroidales bacterium]
MIAIVRYDAGNVLSVINALRRLGVTEWDLTSDPSRLMEADKVLLPGVGDASVALRSLRSLGLDSVILSLQRPVLGICVGMQILCRHTEEGDVGCLGVFDTDVRRFVPGDQGLKVPHMGWNQVEGLSSALFDDTNEGTYMYYVHSYYAGICSDTIASTVHGVRFSAALHRGNFFGTQFHPEKSGSSGARVLKNFLGL